MPPAAVFRMPEGRPVSLEARKAACYVEVHVEPGMRAVGDPRLLCFRTLVETHGSLARVDIRHRVVFLLLVNTSP